MFYNMGTPEDAEYLVDEIVSHEWDGSVVWFHVKWSAGDETLEPIEFVDELEALDNYLDLVGVKDWKRLPKGQARRPTGRQAPAPRGRHPRGADGS